MEKGRFTTISTGENMNNILLVAVNAKFIHSSLALRSINAYCENRLEIVEFTINNDSDYILSSIYQKKPRVVAFSCYIWNIEIILDIVNSIKKLLPDIVVVLGGPEVSYEYEPFFKKGADIIIIGEGEKTWSELLEYFENGEGELSAIDGIAYINADEVIKTKQRAPLILEEIPFVYKDGFKGLENKLIYYEASRGCPYNCQYCLSSIERGVRFLSIERVKSDLKFFLDNRVRQVKFVDRTFNARKSFAIEIWNFLIANDNGYSNFHFEISADILDEECLEVLSRARKQLFQLEIGVQSTNTDTLESIKRKTDLDKLFGKVIKIKSFGNIHQHLDLIAGLPGEDLKSFKTSFNDVYKLEPEQLQLGFLKLLRGSGLREDAKKLGIVYREKAPYEVLYTKEVSYEEMLNIKGVEGMVELYYNSGKAIHTLRYMLSFFEGAYNMYDELASYWIDMGYADVSHNKMKLYTILFEFFSTKCTDIAVLKDILKFDMFLNDNLNNLPDWLEHKDIKEYCRAFFNEENIIKFVPKLREYTPKQVSRMCHLECFDYDIEAWLKGGDINKEQTYILFDYYGGNDLMGNVVWYRVD